MHKPACLIPDDGLVLQCFCTSLAWLRLPKGCAPAAHLAAGKSAGGCRGKGPGPQRCKAPQCHFELKYLFLTFCKRGREKKRKKKKLAVIQSLCKVTGNLPKGFSESRISSPPQIYIKFVVFCISKW